MHRQRSATLRPSEKTMRVMVERVGNASATLVGPSETMMACAGNVSVALRPSKKSKRMMEGCDSTVMMMCVSNASAGLGPSKEGVVSAYNNCVI